jgi:DNA-binding ferritin-like protein (Dps family)
LDCPDLDFSSGAIESIVSWIKKGVFFSAKEYVSYGCPRTFVEALVFLDYIGLEDEIKPLEEHIRDVVVRVNDSTGESVVYKCIQANVLYLYEYAKRDIISGPVVDTLIEVIGKDIPAHCDAITKDIDKEFTRHGLYRRMILSLRDFRKDLRHPKSFVSKHI